MREIRIHGRGGQGAVLAASLLTLSFALEGKQAGGFPHFATFEKKYSPVSSFVRFDDRPIREQMQVYNPDCVIVLDAGLLKAVDLLQGLKTGGVVVWCDEKLPAAVQRSPAVGRAGLVNARNIAEEVLGARIFNTVMLGAFARTTGWVSPESIVAAVQQKMETATADKNARAIMAAYRATKVVDINAARPAGVA